MGQAPTVSSSSSSSSSSYSSASASSHWETELDNLIKDPQQQEHWLYRLLALFIDALVVGVAILIIELVVLLALTIGGIHEPLLYPFSWIPNIVSGIAGIVLVFYITFAETIYGRSLGKSVFHLRAVTVDGQRIDFTKALIRNISKIYWLLLLLDVIGGLIARTQRNQKYSDHIANTNVIKETH